jgi:hypothetical protein
VVWIVTRDSEEQLAILRIAGNNGMITSPISKQSLLLVQPELGLPLGCIGTVATKTGVGQDRLNVPLKVHFLCQANATEQQKQNRTAWQWMIVPHHFYRRVRLDDSPAAGLPGVLIVWLQLGPVFAMVHWKIDSLSCRPPLD